MKFIDCTLDDLTTVAGYECPKDASIETKRVLRKLRKNGIVIFEHDDSPALIDRCSLEDIAGAVGIVYISEAYRLVLIDPEFYKKNTVKNV